MSASIWLMSTQTFALCILRWKSIAPLNRWNLPFKNCNCLCLGSPTDPTVSKTLLCWTADKGKIMLSMYQYSVCRMHITHTQSSFGKTNCLNLMMWSLICVQTLCSLYIKIYVLNCCHASYVSFSTITCRDTVQCGIVTALKDPWRSNNLHQILYVYKYTCTCLISIYFRHFSTETLTFKEMIFLILCWMTESYSEESCHSLEVRAFRQGKAGWVIYI